MTNAEAIETLRANYPDACFEQLRCAVDMAINALTKEAWKEEHPVSPLLQKLATNLQSSKQDADDTISRAAAIDALHKYFDGMLETDTWSPCDVYGLIEILPSVQPEPHWIPCNERLPEKSGRYLVTRGLKVCDSLWNRIYIANYSDLMGLKKQRIWWQGDVGKSDFERLDDVLAWMPLPEPYAERKTDE